MWRVIEGDKQSKEHKARVKGAPCVTRQRGRRIAVAQTAGGVWLGYLGGAVFVPQGLAHNGPDNRGRPERQLARGTQSLRASMAGRIVAQHGEPGAHCAQGQTLVVLEAMKMEYKICAPADGHIAAWHTKPGEAIALDAVLVTFVCDVAS